MFGTLNEIFSQIIFFIGISFCLTVLVAVIVLIIFRSLKTETPKKVGVVLGWLIGILGALFLLVCLTYMLIWTFFVTYQLSYFALNQFFIDSVCVYLSLTITLIVFVYIPRGVGYYALSLFEKVTNARYALSIALLAVTKFLRLKIWLYLFAFLISVLASTENIIGYSLLDNKFWLSINEYVLEAVITFLAFDAFATILHDNWKSIIGDFRKLAKSDVDVKDHE